MVADGAFHHGSLREDLLRRARVSLRESGQDGLSLRQLAREAGVSHGAPRRHFPDRQSLLDGLVREGFESLTAGVREAVRGHEQDNEATFRAVARTYIDFALADAALMDLMFAAKSDGRDRELSSAADEFFTVVGAVTARATSAPGPGVEGTRLQMLLVSTLQGVASLVGSGRLAASQIDELVADAAVLFGANRSRR